MTPLRDLSLSILILAAGKGTRMGAQPKLLLPWRDGKPILWHAARNALSLEPLEVVVVVRPDLPGLVEALADLPVRCVPNPLYAEGMGTSLALGAASLSTQTEGTLLMLGDQPDVPPRIIGALLAAHEREARPITIGRYGERISPPALFSRVMFSTLAQLSWDIGARHLIERDPALATIVQFDAEKMPGDIDTPGDYATQAI